MSTAAIISDAVMGDGKISMLYYLVKEVSGCILEDGYSQYIGDWLCTVAKRSSFDCLLMHIG